MGITTQAACLFPGDLSSHKGWGVGGAYVLTCMTDFDFDFDFAGHPWLRFRDPPPPQNF